MKVTAYRDIQGFPGYRVGDDGSVWSAIKVRGHGQGKAPTSYVSDEWRRLNPSSKKTGHSRVVLYRNGEKHARYVHRLVLEAFVGPCPDGMEACHFPDRDARNNAVSNLRWGTPTDNAADRDAHGTTVRGSAINGSKLSEGDVARVFTLSRQGESQRKIAALVSVSQPAVGMILRGKNWSHLHKKNPSPQEEEGGDVKALSVNQPWAHLIIHGANGVVKHIENRNWNTHYRGPLLVHSGKSRARLGDYGEGEPDESAMVFGAIIGCVTLVDCVPFEKLPPALAGDEFAEGPWCWLLRDPVPLVPFKTPGKVGLFPPPAEFKPKRL